MKTGFFMVDVSFREKYKIKGNELMLYSIINGFTRQGKTFEGSLRYLAEWIGVTRQTVINCIKSLLKKGLIEKIGFNNERRTNIYKATSYEKISSSDESKNLTDDEKEISSDSQNYVQGGVKNLDTDSQKSLEGVVKKLDFDSQNSLTNNIYNNINNNIDNNITLYTNTKNYIDSIKEILKEHNINFKTIVNLKKPIQRIKEVINYAKTYKKGDGWIVNALKYDYELVYDELEYLRTLGSRGYNFTEHEIKLYTELGLL